MTIFEDGQYYGDSEDAILDAMVADAKEYFGEDLKDDDLATIRLFYKPIASFFAEMQQDIGLVLSASQLAHAENTQLDLLTALIGVSRDSATYADGEVTFSREDVAGNDYTIPKGSEIQTNEVDPKEYQTTETVVISEGTTSATAPVKAVEAGEEYNTGANTVITFVDSVPGVQSVTNTAAIEGGSDIETDESLRDRAQEELGEGSRATANSLINKAKALDGVLSVSIFINDTNQDNTDTGGLPDHAFELVVLGGNQQEIGSMIRNTKAAGDTSYAGANGTAVSVDVELDNGQMVPTEYSEPNPIDIYIDLELEKDDNYAGDDAVKNSIVNYIGGLTARGNEDPGDLLVGDDVIYGRVEYAIRDVEGVYDITSLSVGTADDPTGTSDISISYADVATTDATSSTMIDIVANDITF